MLATVIIRCSDACIIIVSIKVFLDTGLNASFHGLRDSSSDTAAESAAFLSCYKKVCLGFTLWTVLVLGKGISDLNGLVTCKYQSLNIFAWPSCRVLLSFHSFSV